LELTKNKAEIAKYIYTLKIGTMYVSTFSLFSGVTLTTSRKQALEYTYEVDGAYNDKTDLINDIEASIKDIKNLFEGENIEIKIIEELEVTSFNLEEETSLRNLKNNLPQRGDLVKLAPVEPEWMKHLVNPPFYQEVKLDTTPPDFDKVTCEVKEDEVCNFPYCSCEDSCKVEASWVSKGTTTLLFEEAKDKE
jgi:hypothetical protein